MNRFLSNERTRAGLLAVAAALIGGTGCVTAMVVSDLQSQQQRKKWEETQQAENAATRLAAERGEVEAMTQLGWYQLNGNRPGVPIDPHGITLLEQAAARHHLPAQYLLGVVLVEGRKGIPPDPARGLELIKLTATKTCTVKTWPAHYNANPARTLGDLYQRDLAGVPANHSDAELWMARDAFHCRSFAPGPYIYTAGLSDDQRRAKLLAWSQLSGSRYNPFATTPSAEQLQETERELRRLRQMVRDSEAKYPAPPQSKQ